MPVISPVLAAAMGRGPAPQPPGAGTLPGQPPFGSNPMSPPVPHRGLEVKGMALVANAKRMLEQAIAEPGLGAETEVGQAILKSLEALGKAIPEGTVSPGNQNAGMQQFMMAQRRENPMTNIIAALGQGQPGAPPSGGGMPAPPSM